MPCIYEGPKITFQMVKINDFFVLICFVFETVLQYKPDWEKISVPYKLALNL